MEGKDGRDRKEGITKQTNQNIVGREIGKTATEETQQNERKERENRLGVIKLCSFATLVRERAVFSSMELPIDCMVLRRCYHQDHEGIDYNTHSHIVFSLALYFRPFNSLAQE